MLEVRGPRNGDAVDDDDDDDNDDDDDDDNDDNDDCDDEILAGGKSIIYHWLEIAGESCITCHGYHYCSMKYLFRKMKRWYRSAQGATSHRALDN